MVNVEPVAPSKIFEVIRQLLRSRNPRVLQQDWNERDFALERGCDLDANGVAS
jgi:hypothetical protein